MTNTYNNELVKFEKFKIELADLMNKYGYRFVEPSDPYYPPMIEKNKTGYNPVELLECCISRDC